MSKDIAYYALEELASRHLRNIASLFQEALKNFANYNRVTKVKSPLTEGSIIDNLEKNLKFLLKTIDIHYFEVEKKARTIRDESG